MSTPNKVSIILQPKDIVLYIILIIGISLIISINIIWLVNKKMSDMEINTTTCPKPNIYIKTGNKNIRLNSRYYDVYDDNDSYDIDNNSYESFESCNNTYLPTDFNTSTDNINNLDSSNGLSTMDVDELNIFKNNITDLQKNDITNQTDNYGYSSNISKIDNNSSYSNVCDSINTFHNNFISTNGNVIQQKTNMYVPKLYMVSNLDVSGNYNNSNIERPSDVDQIGSIPVNDYDGEPLPVNSMM
jgi:hypothetical protein